MGSAALEALGQLVGSCKESVRKIWCSTIMEKDDEGVQEVKVEAFAGSSKGEEGTPVLVRVTAPALQTCSSPRLHVIAVLNISSSGWKRMRQGIEAVVTKLGKGDGLSLVLIEGRSWTAPIELLDMGSKDCITTFDGVMNKIEASKREFVWNMSEDALKVVGRQVEKDYDAGRLRCVMLLSGDEDEANMEEWIAGSQQHEFQLHAFDLGAKPNAGRFKCFAGAYHCCCSVDTKAFTAFVDDLRSVVATSVKVILRGADVRRVETGGHRWDDGKEIYYIADMQACEQKSFIVYLASHAGLTVDLTYQQLPLEGSSTWSLLHHRKDLTVVSQTDVVAAEIARIQLLKDVRDIIIDGDKNPYLGMKESWDSIVKYSGEAKKDLLDLINKDVLLASKEEWQQEQVASWLSCHWWQRETLDVSRSHYSCNFKTRATKPNRRWWWLAAGLVAAVLLFLLLLRLFLVGGGHTIGAFNATMSALDVQTHPEWPAMQEELSAMLDRAKEDRVTSFFVDKGATEVDINHQIDQYIYRVILYAAVLRAHYSGTQSFPKTEVRRHAQTYIQAMLKRTKIHALPDLNVGSAHDMSDQMSHFLYMTIVQAKVLVTIHPPTPIILDDHPVTKDVVINPTPVPDVPKDVVINPTPVPDDPKDKMIKELKDVIIKLQIQIEELQSCCQLVDRCEKKVIDLGGTAKDLQDLRVNKITKISLAYEGKQQLSASEALHLENMVNKAIRDGGAGDKVYTNGGGAGAALPKGEE